MKPIYEHRVEIYKKPVKWDWHEDICEVKQIEVLAYNDKYIILNDRDFTKIEKKGDGFCYPTLNKEAISIFINDSLWEDSVWYKYYSHSKRRMSTIRAHIEKEINKKFSWFINDINLDIIK